MADITEGAQGARLLQQIAEGVQGRFKANRRVLSFEQYLDFVAQRPALQARSAAQYLRDCFDYFGSEERDTPLGKVRRWKLFDCPFDEGRDRVVGQEEAQQEFYRSLTRFVKDGRVQRLILLHGPNGSAKSSFIQCLMRALEAYSQTDEGALYTFQWVFPNEAIARGAIGFGGGKGALGVGDSYAFLSDLDTQARLGSDLRESPLLLLPRAERVEFLQAALKAQGKEVALPAVLSRGELSHRSKQVFEALLTANQGDCKAVLRHVRVERVYLSHRYRVGAVTVEPQLRVDAGQRQITMDRSIQSLPPSLQDQALYESFGDLVDASRGLIEYNDLFKRPAEYNRYLLATSEKATVALDHSILHLDVVLVGSANEVYLEAFKQSPDWPSFKARFDLIRMPYLRSFVVEQGIYDDHLASVELGKPIAPHSTYIASLWAVLTRLKYPNAELYPKIKGVVQGLTPLQKARLYAFGEAPKGLTSEQAKELRGSLRKMADEDAGTHQYEGRNGISARDMKSLLLNAAQNPDYPHLSPLAIFDAIKELMKDPTVHAFLQKKERKADVRAPEDQYENPERLLQIARDHYLDLLDEEVKVAMGLVDEEQYRRFFDRYIEHVTHQIKGEQIYNRTTDGYEDPDENLMRDVEAKVGAGEDARKVRRDIMASIAAWSMDHPGQPLDYATIFPARLEALKRSFYAERADQLRRIKHNLMSYLTSDDNPLNAAESEQAERTLKNLCEVAGHTLASAREAVVFLLRYRYEG